MKKNNTKKSSGIDNFLKIMKYLLIATILIGIFYWVEWRPREIKQTCLKLKIEERDAIKERRKERGGKFSEDLHIFVENHLDKIYRECLVEKGL